MSSLYIRFVLNVKQNKPDDAMRQIRSITAACHQAEGVGGGKDPQDRSLALSLLLSATEQAFTAGNKPVL
jgi:hypothetical protein